MSKCPSNTFEKLTLAIVAEAINHNFNTDYISKNLIDDWLESIADDSPDCEKNWHWLASQNMSPVMVGITEAVLAFSGEGNVINERFTRWHKGRALALAAHTVRENAAIAAARVLAVEPDLRWAFMKGVSIAYRHFPRPWMRPSLDIDMLVHPDDSERLIHLLVENGGQFKPNRVLGFIRRHEDQVAFGGFGFDIHRHPFARSKVHKSATSTLLADRDWIPHPSGVRLPVLSEQSELLLSLTHPILTEYTVYRLSRALDPVLQINSSRITAKTLQHVRELAEHFHCERAFVVSFWLISERFASCQAAHRLKKEIIWIKYPAEFERFMKRWISINYIPANFRQKVRSYPQYNWYLASTLSQRVTASLMMCIRYISDRLKRFSDSRR